MISQLDFISHDEIFSNNYKIQIMDRLCLEVEGSVGQRVTLMTGSLVEMPLMKAPKVKVPKGH
ncbi:Hypothetical predicted protein [Lynx pardinus]|uniref:Uncharacterized protein n=1 Tax=Lynx pardinus TaxID=191816 RepID=A0A485PGA3_LYNPA|nr:Hypothetical predicted protein [Lynx pardinus]